MRNLKRLPVIGETSANNTYFQTLSAKLSTDEAPTIFQIDEASPCQMLFSITIPMMNPSFTICTFITLTNSFKLFDRNLALSAGTTGKETAMPALNIFNCFYGRANGQGIGQAKSVPSSSIYITGIKSTDMGGSFLRSLLITVISF